MYKAISIILLAVITAATVIPHPGKPITHAPRVYKVNMHAPPEVRWAPFVVDYKHAIHTFISEFDLLPIPKTLFSVLDWYAHHVFVHKDFVAEIDALAKLSGIQFGKIFFINFLYEFSTIKACSTILVRSNSGTVYHGRNLDFEMMRLLAPLIAQLDYYDGDKLVYTIDTIIGSVFALTGIRYGAFAANVDTRTIDRNVDMLWSILLDGAIPDVWLLKRVLHEETNYHDAVKRLKDTIIAAPVYFMVSGVQKNEGCVIERSINSVHAFYELNNTNWFLVQTNYDRDQPDKVTDPRRIAVENRIQEQGKVGFNQKILFNQFMSLWPTFNIGTLMTAIMIPGQNYHNTTVWYKSNPTPN